MMKTLFPALCLISSILLFGCGGQDYTYVEEQELKPGPGIFSGKDGEFTVYEGSLPNTKEDKNEKEAEQKE